MNEIETLPWTVACQALLSMEFSRQGSWSGLPFPSPGGLPDGGIEPGSPALQADSLPSEPLGKPRRTIGKIDKIKGCLLKKDRIYTFRYIKRKREDPSKIRNERGSITTEQRKTKLKEAVNNYINANALFLTTL